jgi:hypothetical protein
MNHSVEPTASNSAPLDGHDTGARPSHTLAAVQGRLRQFFQSFLGRDELAFMRQQLTTYDESLRRISASIERLPGVTTVAPQDYGTLTFQCNICGAPCRAPLAELQRERASCFICGSTPRARAIVHMLSTELFGSSLPLPDFAVRKDLVGIGLSDWEGCARRLAEKFSYTNTYFHQEPQLDIVKIDDRLAHSLDFLISSEVFEHVEPPVSRAFVNSRRLLKPGGVLLLTVPFGSSSHMPETIEHFPDLYDYTLSKDETGRYTLTNRTKDGVVQVFETLVFHGGEGATLEMRLFAEHDLLRHLADAGFSQITVYREPMFKFGVYWPQPWSLPIAARV